MAFPFSTNPFDSPEEDFPDPLNSQDSDESESRFFDCQGSDNVFDFVSTNSEASNKPIGRAANINFDKPFDDGETPALSFNRNVASSAEFFSPLESAMMRLGNPATGDMMTSFDSEGELLSQEHTPLLDDRSRTSNCSDITVSTVGDDRKRDVPSEVTSDGRRRSGKGKRRSSQSLAIQAQPDRIMKDLAEGDNEFSMDYKYILLEEMGTRSSWFILLLPYIAFCICLLLESSFLFHSRFTQMIDASDICSGYPATPPETPCHFLFHKGEETTRSFMENNITEGVGFESGIIATIPVIATYLYADALYEGLSTEAVSLVAHGQLEASVELYQEMPLSSDNGKHHWALLSVSEKKSVSMVCERATDNRWDCRTPRLANVVFSMPDTAVFGGGNVRLKILYSAKTENELLETTGDKTADPLYVYTNDKSAFRSVSKIGIDKLHLIEEIAASSGYSIEHVSDLAVNVDTGVRLITFAVTLAFFLYWLYNMGVKSLFGGIRENFHFCFPSSKTSTEWWESHWILFPERYYIILLLVSLLLVQEPLLAAMVLSPTLGASAKLHIAADATIGIGVHGVLFVYLCLFHGFRYHTAAVSKKRSDHQRQILQLRRAAKYIESVENNPRSPSEGAMTKYADDFYDVYGDIDGSVSNNHRLQNDPFGDGWADFLLLKLGLFIVGAASVLATAYCRFPPESDGSFSLDLESINAYRKLFLVSSCLNFVVLLIWIYSLIITVIETGRHLRAERFLATRPVQLAMRIILAHLTLGFMVLVVTFYLNVHRLATKWVLTGLGSVDQGEDLSGLEIAIRVVGDISLTFPYSGTAASVGGGRVLFATVSILITAFIFLPARTLQQDFIDIQDEEKDKRYEQWRLKRDKRLVINLAKEAKSWRVFPLPIDQSIQTTVFEDRVYQLYKNLHIDSNAKDRGIVSLGPYTPIFCLELACWLNEASWQAYFSPKGISSKYFDEAPGIMNLETVGLRMEGVVYDETTDTQVFVATNTASRVDGEEDSVIVVSFRGTASKSNLQTDLRSKQVPLFEQLAGVGSSSFRIHPDRCEIFDEDGWIWNTPQLHGKNVQCVTAWSSPLCMPSHCSKTNNHRLVNPVSRGAKALLQLAPVARDSFPLIHEGFQEVYTHIRRKLLNILFPVLQRQLAKSLKASKKDSSEPLALPKLYLTGHSLGGSLAQLLALDLANNCEIVLPVTTDESMDFRDATPENELFHLPDSYQNPKTGTSGGKKEVRLQPPVAVYSFGQPRVGNKQFSRFYKQRVPHTFRVVNEGDPITSMPNRYFCGGVYKHSGLEVLLDEGMTGNILVGPTVVETMFRFSPVRTNMLAHTMTQYRNCLECAFEEHELLEYYQSQNVAGEEGKGGAQRQSAVSKAKIPDWMTQVGQKRI
ncbi:unnamed protein product [Cylindrotheca closterium]|uniref:Fungal lipase-type domain-containing protein n=1 Tax=Cylindrotheca closterium TaxID=2856 RepID=A0AAD2G0D9_9STRA|nr:unnamed protein product [Cylindrotheca closterium]